MGKMVYLMGKSSTGKDTVFKRLLKKSPFHFKKVVLYTTRPIRDGEKDGEEYFFTNEEGFQKIKAQGKLIEARAYHTYHGLWRYFTVDDGNIDLEKYHYIVIGTLESYIGTANYFGKEKVVPIVLEVDNGVRLQRALDRERQQENPKYQELCRRYLADEEDFSKENMEKAGITMRFSNDDLEKCIQKIQQYLQHEIRK